MSLETEGRDNSNNTNSIPGNNDRRSDAAKKTAALKQAFLSDEPDPKEVKPHDGHGSEASPSSAHTPTEPVAPERMGPSPSDKPAKNAMENNSSADQPTKEHSKGVPDPSANDRESETPINNFDEPDVTFAVEDVPKSPAAYDEPDKVSVFSLFMEKDFRYYFQHPFFRLLIVYLVTFCNFLIYAEDPVAHSEKECFIPVVGNCFSFVCTKYPENAWALLKILMWLAAIICGMIVGKLLVHKFLFNRMFKLKMFDGDQGSWMVMFFTCIFCVFVFSWLYNGLLMIGGNATEDYIISHKMGIKNSWFMKAAACGTWSGDFFTAWMVTDIMLQEKLYPGFAKPIRKWWNSGYNRIVLFWVVCLSLSMVVILVISTDWINWDSLNRDFAASNEISRSFLASFILVMDLLIVMQDWDFPHFINNFDIKLPGLNTAHIKFEVPSFLKEKCIVHITGKWFNYGIIFIVMILDLNMWKNQMFYEPFEYGQYVDERERIHSVQDDESLDLDNATMFTYDWRANNTNPLTNETYLSGDTVMNSRFEGYPLGLKAIAFVPSLAAAICFGVLIWHFGRWHPTEDDLYGGRLKKRRKKRRSWLMRQFSSPSRRKKAKLDALELGQNKDDEPVVILDCKKFQDGERDGDHPPQTAVDL